MQTFLGIHIIHIGLKPVLGVHMTDLTVVSEMQLLQKDRGNYRMCCQKLQEDVSSWLWERKWHTSPVLRYIQVCSIM